MATSTTRVELVVSSTALTGPASGPCSSPRPLAGRIADFPFGLPRRAIADLDWPPDLASPRAPLRHAQQTAFRAALDAYRRSRRSVAAMPIAPPTSPALAQSAEAGESAGRADVPGRAPRLLAAGVRVPGMLTVTRAAWPSRLIRAARPPHHPLRTGRPRRRKQNAERHAARKQIIDTLTAGPVSSPGARPDRWCWPPREQHQAMLDDASVIFWTPRARLLQAAAAARLARPLRPARRMDPLEGGSPVAGQATLSTRRPPASHHRRRQHDPGMPAQYGRLLGMEFASASGQDKSFAQLIRPFTTRFWAQYGRVSASPKPSPITPESRHEETVVAVALTRHRPQVPSSAGSGRPSWAGPPPLTGNQSHLGGISERHPPLAIREANAKGRDDRRQEGQVRAGRRGRPDRPAHRHHGGAAPGRCRGERRDRASELGHLDSGLAHLRPGGHSTGVAGLDQTRADAAELQRRVPHHRQRRAAGTGLRQVRHRPARRQARRDHRRPHRLRPGPRRRDREGGGRRRAARSSRANSPPTRPPTSTPSSPRSAPPTRGRLLRRHGRPGRPDGAADEATRHHRQFPSPATAAADNDQTRGTACPRTPARCRACRWRCRAAPTSASVTEASNADVQVYAPYAYDAAVAIIAAMHRKPTRSEPSRYLPELREQLPGRDRQRSPSTPTATSRKAAVTITIRTAPGCRWLKPPEPQPAHPRGAPAARIYPDSRCLARPLRPAGRSAATPPDFKEAAWKP